MSPAGLPQPSLYVHGTDNSKMVSEDCESAAGDNAAMSAARDVCALLCWALLVEREPCSTATVYITGAE